MQEKTFTTRDHLLGVCDIFEVGTPWEDRYSKTDAFEGRCISAHIGSAKAAVVDPMALPGTLLTPEPEPPAQDEPMGEDVFEIELAAYRADPARYRSGNASNLNKLLEMAARKQEKREEKAPAHDKLTAADLAKMTLADFRVLLVDVVLEYVPEERQETVLQMLRR